MTGYNTVFAEGSSNRCLPIENIKLIQLYFIGFNGELFEISITFGVVLFYLYDIYVFCSFIKNSGFVLIISNRGYL